MSVVTRDKATNFIKSNKVAGKHQYISVEYDGDNYKLLGITPSPYGDDEYFTSVI